MSQEAYVKVYVLCRMCIVFTSNQPLVMSSLAKPIVLVMDEQSIDRVQRHSAIWLFTQKLNKHVMSLIGIPIFG